MKHSKQTKSKISETLKRKGIAPKQVPWTEERRKKLSNSLKGRFVSKQSIKKRVATRRRNGNNKHSDETKKKMSDSATGRKVSQETRLKLSNSKRGIKQSYESRKKRSISIQGMKEEDWGGFKYSENERIRHSDEWKKWRKLVFDRDGFICKKCNLYRKEIHPHHIKPLVDYPELAFNINNGITLCKDCHMNLHGLERKKDVIEINKKRIPIGFSVQKIGKSKVTVINYEN